MKQIEDQKRQMRKKKRLAAAWELIQERTVRLLRLNEGGQSAVERKMIQIDATQCCRDCVGSAATGWILGGQVSSDD
jgi:hypothetical protein